MAQFTNYRPGLGAVGQYQASGVPFATSSLDVTSSDGGTGDALQVKFPSVTKFVTIHNTTSGTNKPLRVGFSELGTLGNTDGSVQAGENHKYYFVLNNGESYTGDWKVNEVWLVGDRDQRAGTGTGHITASVIAGLTSIRESSITGRDGSGRNWSGSAGVG